MATKAAPTGKRKPAAKATVANAKKLPGGKPLKAPIAAAKATTAKKPKKTTASRPSSGRKTMGAGTGGNGAD